jgi:hypothetical protein
MKLSYDFDRYKPPRLTEKQLTTVILYRQMMRRSIILMAASQLIFLCLALAAYVLAPYSIILSFVCLGLLGLYLICCGVLAVLLSKKMMDRNRTAFSIFANLQS